MGALLCKSQQRGNKKRKAVGQRVENSRKKQNISHPTSHAARLEFERQIRTLHFVGLLYEQSSFNQQICVEAEAALKEEPCLIDLNYRSDERPLRGKSVAEWIIFEIGTSLHTHYPPVPLDTLEPLVEAMTIELQSGRVNVKELNAFEVIVPFRHFQPHKFTTKMITAALKYACNEEVLSREMVLAAELSEHHTMRTVETRQSVFELLRFLQSLGGDINAVDSKTGRTVMHHLVHADSFTVLSHYICADMPGVDWLVQDKNGRNFVQLARLHCSCKCTTRSMCDMWEARWRSVVVPELQEHLPVVSQTEYVLAELVLSYLIQDTDAPQSMDIEDQESEESAHDGYEAWVIPRENQNEENNERQEEEEEEEQDGEQEEVVMPTDLDQQLINALAAQV
jgi:hypothetical protein